MPSPLSGIRVLEFAWTLPGPYCGHLLAELGAEVIKVEPPGSGDSLRTLMPGMFGAFNRGKKSVVLNLKAADAGEVVAVLAAASDVVLEGFRPGVAARLGIGPDTLRSLHPALIYCSISGFGQTGPFATTPGHDATYGAIAGVYGRAGTVPEDPAMSPIPIGDLATGALAAVSILSSLLGRQTSGLGEYCDISITDVLATWTAAKAGEFLESGDLPVVSEQQPPTHGLYRARDGAFVAIGAIEDHFWQQLCVVIGRRDWLANPKLGTNRGRSLARAEVARGLATAFLEDDADRWVDRLSGADVPAARVLAVDEAFRQSLFTDRGVVVERGRQHHIGFPAVFEPARRREHGIAPQLGADTEAVLLDVGADPADIERWLSGGTITHLGASARELEQAPRRADR